MIGIYKIENLINSKVYIGQSIDVENRWKEHIALSHTKTNNIEVLKRLEAPLYRALKKYGEKNFSFEVVEECSLDKLNEREQYWIDYYHSFYDIENSNGYNLTTGGDGIQRISKEEYSEWIKMWNDGNSVLTISKKCNRDSQTITRYLKLYSPSYTKEEIEKRRKNNNKLPDLSRLVNQYDLVGNFIKTYKSATEGAKAVGGLPDQVRRAAKGTYGTKTCKNFYWIFADEEQNILKRIANGKGCSQVIEQYSLENKLIKRYPSLKEANEAMKLSRCAVSIRNCCLNKRENACGYKWKYMKEENK